MEVQLIQKNGYTKAMVAGRIDTVTSAEFESAVMKAFESEKQEIVLDCTKLDYISSSGLRIFLLLQKKAKASAVSLSVCCLNPSIKEIFDISGFSGIFTIHSEWNDVE
ncbi:MAG: STAS domain-containing protein [Bacteroidales bacterium]